MRRLRRWACWLWLSGFLGVTSGSQRPCWYYGELGGQYGPPEAYRRPPETAFPAQMVALYSYWVIQGVLVILGISLASRLAKHAYKALKKRVRLVPLRQEDPEELALMETLHLLDAVMMKMWRHLKWLERKKRRPVRGHPKAPH